MKSWFMRVKPCLKTFKLSYHKIQFEELQVKMSMHGKDNLSDQTW